MFQYPGVISKRLSVALSYAFFDHLCVVMGNATEFGIISVVNLLAKGYTV